MPQANRLGLLKRHELTGNINKMGYVHTNPSARNRECLKGARRSRFNYVIKAHRSKKLFLEA